MLLDQVQKRKRISPEAHRRLKAAKLVEGRYPNLIVLDYSIPRGFRGSESSLFRARKYRWKVTEGDNLTKVVYQDGTRRLTNASAGSADGEKTAAPKL